MTNLREFVYISNSKLQQFRDEDGANPRSWAERLRAIGLKLPLGLGELSIDTSKLGNRPALPRVLEFIDGNRRPRTKDLSEYPDLAPGEWFTFDCPLLKRVIVAEPTNILPELPIAMFWQAAHVAGPHLLMHGSVASLTRVDKEFVTVNVGSATDAELFWLRLQDVALYSATLDDSASPAEWPAMARFLMRLRGDVPDLLAVWMAGYARVSWIDEEAETVVASPLYVEIVSPPEDQEG